MQQGGSDGAGTRDSSNRTKWILALWIIGASRGACAHAYTHDRRARTEHPAVLSFFVSFSLSLPVSLLLCHHWLSNWIRRSRMRGIKSKLPSLTSTRVNDDARTLCGGGEGQNSLPHKSRSRVLLGKEKAGNKGMLLDSYRPDLSFSSSLYSFFALFSLYQTMFELWQGNIYIYIQCSFLFSFFENMTE